MTTPPISFRNPLTHIWGFHCHNDIPRGDDFANALLIQRACIDFLHKHNAPIVRDESYWPGYGPHKLCMWEIRIELEVSGEVKTKILEAREDATNPRNLQMQPDAIEQMKSKNYDFAANAKRLLPQIGLASLWMLKNNRGQGGYIHIIDHDESLEFRPMIAQEAVEHQNILFFNKYTNIDINFFLNPPMDEATGELKDTRTHAIMKKEDREELMKTAPHGVNTVFQSDVVTDDKTSEPTPISSISVSKPSALYVERGFRVFVGFSGRSEAQRNYGLAVYAALLQFLEENDQHPDEKWIEEDANRANAGFCFTFLKSEKKSTVDVCSNIGYALTYLMLNRGPLDVSLVPVGFHLGSEVHEKNVKSVRTLGQELAFVGQPPSLMGREIRFGSN